jgi:ABC-2 type transport system ATP-binding protein
MDEAERCHRLAFFQHGRIVASGTPGEIICDHMPGKIIEITCEETATALQLLRAMDGLDVSLHGAQIHVMADDVGALRQPVRDLLTRAGMSVIDMHIADPSLEDAFIASVRAPTSEGE